MVEKKLTLYFPSFCFCKETHLTLVLEYFVYLEFPIQLWFLVYHGEFYWDPGAIPHYFYGGEGVFKTCISRWLRKPLTILTR